MGTDTARKRQDHARHPKGDTAIASFDRAAREQYDINPKTVMKWRARASVEDLKTGPKDPRSTVLSADEEALCVAFRKHTLLALDECGYLLQTTIRDQLGYPAGTLFAPVVVQLTISSFIVNLNRVSVKPAPVRALRWLEKPWILLPTAVELRSGAPGS